MSNGSFCCITTDYVESDLDWEEEQYRSAGIDFHQHQLRLASADDLGDAAADADVLVVDQAAVTADVVKRLHQCRLIIRHGDGYDNLDLAAATEAGIVCINEPGFWSREVAEQAFAAGISLALKIPSQQSVASKPRLGQDAGWDLKSIMPYRSMGSLTVGIIGCGKIGSLASRFFGALAGKVLVADPYIAPEKIGLAGGEAVSLDTLLAESDIVSIHTPLTPETTGMFNSERIAAMKQGAILINTARGPLVDTDAVLDAIDSGQLGGAALDSTVPEPLPGDHPLFSRDNVIITPHMGWYSEDALWALRKQIVLDVLGARDGIVPKSVVNPEVLSQSNLRFKKD